MRAAFAIVLCACGARSELAGTATISDAGADVSSGCHDEIIASDAKGASVIALDGDDVFWGTPDGLVRARRAGVTTTLASESAGISSIAVDPTDHDHVYYATIGAIRRVSRSGGVLETIVDHAGEPFAISFSNSDGGLYYVDYGAGIAAGSVHQILGLGNFTLIDGLDTPGGLAVTDSGVFTASALALVHQQGVMGPLLRANHDGSGLTVVRDGVQQASGLAAFGGRVYFIEQADAQSTLHGGVRSIDESGGETKIEVATDGFLPIDLAVDASGVWATAYSQSESDLFHGSTVVAKTPGVFYESVRTNESAVYWAIAWSGAPPADHASVRKICK